jgi:4-diphosphocytidyl-2-C-methyl-D-erythritol kinase
LANDIGGRLWRAPAKINLSLHVLGRRLDGYHELESVVAFSGFGDLLAFTPDEDLALTIEGPTAAETGATDDNLVLKAARALAARVSGLRLGRFHLRKALPVAAGLGGGSSDAAAALRALAHHNAISLDDPRLIDAARATGADVPVCLEPRARVMAGIGDQVGPPLDLSPLPSLLVNPGVPAPTPRVFAALGLERGAAVDYGPAVDYAHAGGLFAALLAARNDLQPAALRVAPEIAEALEILALLPGARLARMSGSGATCFAVFSDRAALMRGTRAIKAQRPRWWARPTYLR